MNTNDLTAAQRSAIIEVCVAAHDDEEFRNLFGYVKGAGRHFLEYDGAALASHAVVTTRWVQPDGHPELKTAYIDAVSTLPNCQGRGHASAVMRTIAGIDDYAIGCLQTDRVTFYDRLGWMLWRGPLAGRGEHGLIPTPDQRGVMVLRFASTPPLDLGVLLTIERQPERIWE